jgi:hypothetical protein
MLRMSQRDRSTSTTSPTNPERGAGRAVVVAVGAGLATVAAYLLFLGWHAGKTLDPQSGRESGPYDAWQVGALVVGIASIAFVAGRLGFARVAIAVVPVSLAAVFAVDAATRPDADGLWIIGAVLILLGAAAGVATISLVARRR